MNHPMRKPLARSLLLIASTTLAACGGGSDYIQLTPVTPSSTVSGVAATGLPTMMFRSQYANHYRALNVEVPPGAKEKGEMDDTIAFWQTLPPEQRHALLNTIGAAPNLSPLQTPDAA